MYYWFHALKHYW